MFILTFWWSRNYFKHFKHYFTSIWISVSSWIVRLLIAYYATHCTAFVDSTECGIYISHESHNLNYSNLQCLLPGLPEIIYLVGNISYGCLNWKVQLYNWITATAISKMRIKLNYMELIWKVEWLQIHHILLYWIVITYGLWCFARDLPMLWTKDDQHLLSLRMCKRSELTWKPKLN